MSAKVEDGKNIRRRTPSRVNISKPEGKHISTRRVHHQRAGTVHLRSTGAKGRQVVARKKRVLAADRTESRTVGVSTPQDLKWIEEDPKDHLLSRFIYDSRNKKIGESIGVEKGQLIMKSGKRFYSIPLTNISERGNELRLHGHVDKKRAAKLGELWRKKALDPLYQKRK